ncbi:SAM_2 domain-containing protein [Cephalotus follicularis]|uniref:SAM_2 domain-containing protein n=1 Tax=Cephalotus follicularis TaxID=3775 RepID=A0A1Q3ANE3_CEPFO|nr:SAM_2 domain-containing protein [Cephalotus follicularis]
MLSPPPYSAGLQLMVKTKQRHSATMPASKNGTPSGLTNSLNFDAKVGLNGDDSWVIVKMQKVTILVPPLPAAKKSAILNLRPSQQQTSPRKTANHQSHISTESYPKMLSVEEREKSTTLVLQKEMEIARKTPAQHIPTLTKPPVLDLRKELENSGQVYTSKPRDVMGISNTSITLKQQRVLHGTSVFLDRSALLKQRMRVANLDRKLQKAGGLSKWLASLGLGQFVKIFQGKGVNKFQLVNLTMKKLKDMGADAVGPRRKLMHAIDCVCQPYCPEAF